MEFRYLKITLTVKCYLKPAHESRLRTRRLFSRMIITINYYVIFERNLNNDYF